MALLNIRMNKAMIIERAADRGDWPQSHCNADPLFHRDHNTKRLLGLGVTSNETPDFGFLLCIREELWQRILRSFVSCHLATLNPKGVLLVSTLKDNDFNVLRMSNLHSSLTLHSPSPSSEHTVDTLGMM